MRTSAISGHTELSKKIFFYFSDENLGWRKRRNFCSSLEMWRINARRAMFTRKPWSSLVEGDEQPYRSKVGIDPIIKHEWNVVMHNFFGGVLSKTQQLTT